MPPEVMDKKSVSQIPPFGYSTSVYTNHDNTRKYAIFTSKKDQMNKTQFSAV